MALSAPTVDIPSSTQVSQWGVEVTEGTAVAASKRLTALGIEPKAEGNIDSFRPMGYFYPTVAIPGKEWASGKITGALDYNSLAYLLCGLLQKVSPTGGGNAKTWTYNPSSTNIDNIQPYTLEIGNGQRARRIVNTLINELSMQFTREKISLDGGVLGKQIQEDVYLSTCELQTWTMTGTPTGGNVTVALTGYPTTGVIAYNSTAAAAQTVLDTAWGVGNTVVAGGPWPGTPLTVTYIGVFAAQNVALPTVGTNALTGGTSPNVTFTETTPGVPPTEVTPQPVMPKEIDLYLDDTSGTLGTTQYTRGFMASMKLGNRWTTVWPLSTSQSSWAGRVAAIPASEIGLLLGADGNATALLGQQRNAVTKYMRIKATGPSISGGGNFSLQIDLAVKFTKMQEYKDENGVYAMQFGGEIFHDPTWGKALSITLVNTLASL